MFNDRKATRFSNRKYRVNIVSLELYKKWKEQTNFDISFSEFKNIWKLIGKEYINSVVKEKDGAKLGASIGDLYIGFIPNSKTKCIDFNTSLKLGKKVHFQNWDTGGKMGKIIYGTRGRKYIYKLHRYWGFTASRNFKHIATKAFTTHPERYKNSIEKRSLI